MRRFRSILVTGGVGAALLAAGCSGDEPATGPSAAVQTAKPASTLKVTPPQVNLAGTGVSTTLNASSTSGPIAVAVSSPACVSVSLKNGPQNQAKFTVTATAAGTCTLTVTDGGTGSVQVPVRVAATATLVRSTLVAGIYHTCGLNAAGAAYCWGFNGFGQTGSTTGLGSALANPTPVAVMGGVTFASLTGGGYHTCGLTPAGAAYCWGSNYTGQLGNPANSGVLNGPDSRNPTPLLVDGNLTFSVLEAGADHTCGITTQGALYCWGNNRLGQLGTTTNNGVSLPNPTPTPVPGGLTYRAIGAGTDHTCAVATSGVAYCWGDNSNGQLGNADGIGDGLPHPTPTVVQGVPTLASFAAGGHYTCGLTAAGAAWCWGDNGFGALGAVTAAASWPTPVAVGGGLSFASLGAGGGHTCGLTSGGTLYCWGGNLLGQLGSTVNFGTSTPSYTPTAVSGLTLAGIAINSAHSCGVTASGQALCWGFNRYGQLGNTTNNDTDVGVPTPTAVIGGLTFATQ
jgi:alpha-tubulin suppressor-like RCC1 family protein